MWKPRISRESSLQGRNEPSWGARSTLVPQSFWTAALDAVVVMDLHGRIVGMESGSDASNLFGWSAVAEALGEHWRPRSSREALRQSHETGLTHFRLTGEGRGAWPAIEVPALRRDGQEFRSSFGAAKRPVRRSACCVGSPGAISASAGRQPSASSACSRSRSIGSRTAPTVVARSPADRARVTGHGILFDGRCRSGLGRSRRRTTARRPGAGMMPP